MDIKIINAGNCVLCGRKIKVTKQRNNKLPNIFFCPRCERRINKEMEEKNGSRSIHAD